MMGHIFFSLMNFSLNRLMKWTPGRNLAGRPPPKRLSSDDLGADRSQQWRRDNLSAGNNPVFPTRGVN